MVRKWLRPESKPAYDRPLEVQFGTPGTKTYESEMSFHLLPITLFAALINAESISLAGTNSAQEQQPKKKRKTENASLTGCVDGQDDHYVVVDERTLTPIADLETYGLPTEGIAKHAGHKERSEDFQFRSRPPRFQVHNADTVSENRDAQHY